MHAVGKIDELIIRDRHAASQVIVLTARLKAFRRMSATKSDDLNGLNEGC